MLSFGKPTHAGVVKKDSQNLSVFIHKRRRKSHQQFGKFVEAYI